MRLFEENQPRSNANRWRLSGVAKSLTLGAQTGRGSDNGCVIRRTLEQRYVPLIQLVHQLAQSVVGQALPYLGFQILGLEQGQVLNQHRDNHNRPDYPNHTMKFGKLTGGSLQMLREEAWHSYDKDNVWLSFDALKVTLRVTEVISTKSRFDHLVHTRQVGLIDPK